MPLCPRGHHSDTDDFCDECGAPMGGDGAPGSGVSRPVGASALGAEPAASGPAVPEPAAGVADEVCPLCGTPRDGRFCEEDGHDFVLAAATGAAPAPSTPASAPSTPASAPATPAAAPGRSVGTGDWVVVVDADRRYFDSVVARRGPDIGAVTFPTYYPRTEVALDGTEVRIGRRRGSGTGAAPGVDLTGPPLDPGISRLHAVLLADGSGGWGVLDPGSTNGTTVNYGDETIPADTVVPLRPGDRVHVGAYTTLVVERR